MELDYNSKTKPNVIFIIVIEMSASSLLPFAWGGMEVGIATKCRGNVETEPIGI